MVGRRGVVKPGGGFGEKLQADQISASIPRAVADLRERGEVGGFRAENNIGASEKSTALQFSKRFSPEGVFQISSASYSAVWRACILRSAICPMMAFPSYKRKVQQYRGCFELNRVNVRLSYFR
jgi:hypothetical protein